MKKIIILSSLLFLAALIFSFKKDKTGNMYRSAYMNKLDQFRQQEQQLLQLIETSDLNTDEGLEKIKAQVNVTRVYLKGMDFWFRYLEPIAYKLINGPLPVEWETEVFEKFEKPYKREGAGLTLAAIYMEEDEFEKDSLSQLVRIAVDATEVFAADSITQNLGSFHHFYLCNRLFLLNLAAIYTTGFECPDTEQVIPELRSMLTDVNSIYESFNEDFPDKALNQDYISLYRKAINFAAAQPDDLNEFDHFTFIRDYINPLFVLNQRAIIDNKVRSRSFVDYSLNRNNFSIFSKGLYNGLNPKGIYLRVDDEKALKEIAGLGKLLFYDPILSGNNKRSCASCHKPNEYFTDTTAVTSMQFDGRELLPRNTPSLINVVSNHLAMLDGQHISLQHQTRAVIINPTELGGKEEEILRKVLSCPDYKKELKKLLVHTPQEMEITFEHITSAVSFYYSQFSNYYSPFDLAMNEKKSIPENAKKGFNLFMSKAQCATCHFVPQFNGVKPPYVGSEFEVLGVPADTAFTKISPDKGRYQVNPAFETLHAFRTGSLRNIMYTGPYMHNGVFKTMEEVIDFYDRGGGAGRGLDVINQTLSSDSLKLTKAEKDDLIHFLRSLNEDILFDKAPSSLPHSKISSLNARRVGGEY